MLLRASTSPGRIVKAESLLTSVAATVSEGPKRAAAVISRKITRVIFVRCGLFSKRVVIGLFSLALIKEVEPLKTEERDIDCEKKAE